MAQRVLELVEHQSADFAADVLNEEEARGLEARFGNLVDIEPPTYKTGGRWRLTARSWVGYIIASPQLVVILQPKVGTANVYRMVEYAYGIDLKFSDGNASAGKAPDLPAHLGRLLADGVLRRLRHGLYRDYVDQEAELACVRGRIDYKARQRAPWRVGLPCSYSELTTDIEDNQILAWGLHLINRAHLVREDDRRACSEAYRALRALTTLQPIASARLEDRSYTRLNPDYRRLHAIARFFIDQASPTTQSGPRETVPFLVSMSRLFERFVAGWLQRQLPHSISLRVQRPVVVDKGKGLSFALDVLLEDRSSKSPLLVLETKYKSDPTSSGDIAQVAAYCAAVGCSQAILVYPDSVNDDLRAEVGAVRIYGASFPLEGDLNANGNQVLAKVARLLGRTLD